MKIKILTIVSLCICSTAFAGGYRVSLQGQNATGMGHTGVAISDNPETVFFNPAGMSFLENKMNLATGVTLVDGITKFQNAETNTVAQTDNPLSTPAYLYLTRKFNQDISYGFGFYTPYGNTVKWEDDWAGSHLVNEISLQALYFQPTVSYKLQDLISVGVGVNFVSGGVEYNRNLTSALEGNNGEQANVTLDASNINSWGYNVGILVKPHKMVSLGVSYRSKVDLKARGESAVFENVPSSMTGVYADTTFDADLVLPAELTAGASLTFGGTTLAVDVNRAFWSAYDSLDISFENGLDPSLNPRNYQDANIYRFGIQQRFSKKFTLRMGAYYDESPITAGYFTPETARNDSIGLTAGISYAVTKRFGIDASLLYLMFDEFGGGYDYVGHDEDEQTQDTSFEGEYVTSVRTIGLGINYQY